jgi:hypothetical protein
LWRGGGRIRVIRRSEKPERQIRLGMEDILYYAALSALSLFLLIRGGLLLAFFGFGNAVRQPSLSLILALLSAYLSAGCRQITQIEWFAMKKRLGSQDIGFLNGSDIALPTGDKCLHLIMEVRVAVPKLGAAKVGDMLAV